MQTFLEKSWLEKRMAWNEPYFHKWYHFFLLDFFFKSLNMYGKKLFKIIYLHMDF